MLNRLNHIRLLRYAGLFTWAATGCWLVSVWLDASLLQAESAVVIAELRLRVARWVVA